MKQLLVLVFLLLLSLPASADMELGALRVATSSATFLKIGISPRAEAMGGAWVAVAEDANAAWYNPAGLGLLANREVSVASVAWPAGIRYNTFSWGVPRSLFAGTWSLQIGSLSAVMQETDEYHPYGTGREFLYSDFLAGLSFARFLTDQLIVGLGAKYFREDLGSEVGGPVANAWVVDVGTLYHIDYRNMRIGMAIQNFGPEIRPQGEFWNHSDQKWQEFDGYPPPSLFKLGIAYEPWKSWPWILTHTFDMNHLADNRESLSTGLELDYHGGLLALRAGYNFMADEFGLSAGFGSTFALGSTIAGLDYSFTDAKSLGAIHRWSLRLDF